ncbi:SsgA family sporulation/cell division regulator [Streptomyces sp. NPDC001544]|uniref:SsgA family sporulation/cell division regulator n=1 Tax=Streptomyces sp. NPDC001544 TaxID=3364584 RepID=UPI0036916639
MDFTFAQPTHARLITAGDRTVPVTATLRYTTEDPLAVFIDFPPRATLDGEGATWTFARSLLDQGLDVPAGSGDVRIWPCDPGRTVLELHSPYGVALLQFGTPALRRFLRRSYAAVAAGREDVEAVVDRGLSALFGGV